MCPLPCPALRGPRCRNRWWASAREGRGPGCRELNPRAVSHWRLRSLTLFIRPRTRPAGCSGPSRGKRDAGQEARRSCGIPDLPRLRFASACAGLVIPLSGRAHPLATPGRGDGQRVSAALVIPLSGRAHPLAAPGSGAGPGFSGAESPAPRRRGHDLSDIHRNRRQARSLARDRSAASRAADGGGEGRPGRPARAEGRINRWHASVATRSAISSRRRSPSWTGKVER